MANAHSFSLFSKPRELAVKLDREYQGGDHASTVGCLSGVGGVDTQQRGMRLVSCFSLAGIA